jgi:desulfoferrodoxin (superoxide reductase-like protein)
MKSKSTWLGFGLVLVFLSTGVALADKAAVSIEGPVTAAKGSEVTIKVTVTHSANTARHYIEWVKISANNQEVAIWKFGDNQRPEAAVFTKEVKLKVLDATEIKAEASCNVHGSKGPGTFKISVQ